MELEVGIIADAYIARRHPGMERSDVTDARVLGGVKALETRSRLLPSGYVPEEWARTMESTIQFSWHTSTVYLAVNTPECSG